VREMFRLTSESDVDDECVTGDFREKDLEQALEFAIDALEHAPEADAEFEHLAPNWPARRQAAVDRAILRLAHREMTSGASSPKIAVNEAVELAHQFSTDRSSSFVNALLDKVLKRVLQEDPSPGASDPSHLP
ncbi:MAG: transcription antitermination protein NusB, partial [Phycisphaerales bacterium]|nr:transcription antitermination protein NusB [Phycisphaerales bacterium]